MKATLTISKNEILAGAGYIDSMNKIMEAFGAPAQELSLWEKTKVKFGAEVVKTSGPVSYGISEAGIAVAFDISEELVVDFFKLTTVTVEAFVPAVVAFIEASTKASLGLQEKYEEFGEKHAKELGLV